MFFLSLVVLQKSKLCQPQNLTSYSIASGIALYGGIYLYFLYYNPELLSIFNKFLIYIVSVDLLLSTFYFYQLNSKPQLEHNLNTNNNNLETSDDLFDSELTENEDEVSDEDNDNVSDDNLSDDNVSEEDISYKNPDFFDQNAKIDNETNDFSEKNEEPESTEVILQEIQNNLQEVDDLIQNNINEKEQELTQLTNTNDQHNILLMDENIEIRPRRRNKKSVLQV